MVNKDDLVISVILLILGVFFLTHVNSFPEGVDITPRFIAWTIIILATILPIQSFSSLKKNDEKFQSSKPVITKKAMGIFLLTVFCVVFVNFIGFYISSVAFMIVVSLYLGGLSKKTIVSSIVIFNIFIYLIFSLYLEVQLPSGIFI